MQIGKEDKNSLFVGNMILDADYLKQAKKKKAKKIKNDLRDCRIQAMYKN